MIIDYKKLVVCDYKMSVECCDYKKSLSCCDYTKFGVHKLYSVMLIDREWFAIHTTSQLATRMGFTSFLQLIRSRSRDGQRSAQLRTFSSSF